MARPAQLEAFEIFSHEGNADPEAGPSEDWHEGHAEGYAQGLADAEAEQGRLKSDLVQSLGSQAFGYFEARDHLLGTLRPMFETLAAVFAPELARAVLPLAVTESLTRIAEAQMNQPITIAVAPSLRPVIESLSGQYDDHPLYLHDDPTLGENQVVISGGDSEEIVDLHAVLEEVRGILSAIMSETEASAING